MLKIKKLLQKIASLFTGEFWLTCRHKCNGGGVIFFRSLWIAFQCVIYLTVLKRYVFDEPFILTGDFTKQCFIEGLQQFSAVFAFTYLALYARFAAQWRYLADLYNKIKETEVKYINDNEGSPESSDDAKRDPLREWKAGFIEDADELHLATKKIFMSVIYHWLDDEKIRKEFEKNTPGGLSHLNHLWKRVEKAYKAHDDELKERYKVRYCDMKFK